MLDLFKQDIKIGDKVKLYLTTGIEPQGEIIEIGTNFLLLKKSDGTISRIFEVLIGGWDLLNVLEKPSEEDTNDIPDLNEEASQTFDLDESEQNSVESNEVILNQHVETVEVTPIGSNSLTNLGVKVVGKIELNDKDKQRNRFPNGRTYRIREVASILELSVSEVVLR